MDLYLEITLGILALFILILPFMGKDFINKTNSKLISKITGLGWIFFAITVFAAVLNAILIIRRYNVIEIENEAEIKKNLVFEKNEEKHQKREMQIIERMTSLERAIKKGGYKYDSVKGVISPRVNIQKIEKNGSGIQNNAPNYGNQAGRDLYIAERTLNNDELNSILSDIEVIHKENKTKCIGFSVVQGSNGGKALAQLKNVLIKHGYDLENGYNQTSVYSKPIRNMLVHFNETFNCAEIIVGTFE